MVAIPTGKQKYQLPYPSHPSSSPSSSSGPSDGTGGGSASGSSGSRQVAGVVSSTKAVSGQETAARNGINSDAAQLKRELRQLSRAVVALKEVMLHPLTNFLMQTRMHARVRAL